MPDSIEVASQQQDPRREAAAVSDTQTAPETRLGAAQQYLARGWQPVPIPPGLKGPRHKNWQKDRFTAERLPAHFGGDGNIGVMLGTPSGDTVDIDLDAFGVADLADRFLPKTDAVFGRSGKPRSHRIYHAPGVDKRIEQFSDPLFVKDQRDPATGEKIKPTLAEFRAQGQTVFPPSKHEDTGEDIGWHSYGEPALVSAEDLLRCTTVLAVAILVRKHLPEQESGILALPQEEWAAALGKKDPRLQQAATEWFEFGARRHVWREERRRYDIGHEPFIAPDLFELASALRAIRCEDLNYEDWIKMLAALKAACNDDWEFFYAVVLPWCLDYPDNSAELVEYKWERIYDSSLGWGYIWDQARKRGWEDLTLRDHFPVNYAMHGDLYKRLGVAPTATQPQIEAAYHERAKENHPDLHRDDPQAEERMKSINAAFEILSDKAKRAEYDQERAEAARSRHPGPKPSEDKRPIIFHKPENMADTISEAEQAVIEANLDIYQRGDLIVMPSTVDYRGGGNATVKARRLVPVTSPRMAELMGMAAVFTREEKKPNNWKTFTPSRAMADRYLARVGAWKLPVLYRVITAPTITRWGEIIDKEGYDRSTGLKLEMDHGTEGADFYALWRRHGDLPEKPTREEALYALGELCEPIREFPFVDETARAAMIGAMLTAVARYAVPMVPLHAFDAPIQGSGKGLLNSIIVILAEGHKAIPISAATKAEFEKRLDAELIAGASVISIDNVMEELDLGRLATILTEPVVNVRVLGQSKTVRCPTGVMVLANGNNLTIGAEIGRRTIRIVIDPQTERPWERKFKHDCIAMTLSQRARYVRAALTILRAFHVAGAPKPQGSYGSFQAWYDLIVGTLLWLGLPDPTTTVAATTADDPKLAAFAAVVEAWGPAFGDVPVTAKELCGQGSDFPDDDDGDDGVADAERGKIEAARGKLREALKLATQPKNCKLDPIAVGYWLRKFKLRVSAGKCITPATLSRGDRRWQLQDVQALPQG